MTTENRPFEFVSKLRGSTVPRPRSLDERRETKRTWFILSDFLSRGPLRTGPWPGNLGIDPLVREKAVRELLRAFVVTQ